jgi:hypothetical protein
LERQETGLRHTIDETHVQKEPSMIACLLSLVGLLALTASGEARTSPEPPPPVILAGEVDEAFANDPNICANYVSWMDELDYAGLLDMEPFEASEEFFFSWPNALFAWHVEWFEGGFGSQRTLSPAGYEALRENLDQCLQDAASM